jgi:hypothetical protein
MSPKWIPRACGLGPPEPQQSGPSERAWEVGWNLSRGDRKTERGHALKVRADDWGLPIRRPEGATDGIVQLRAFLPLLHQDQP